MKKSLIFAVLLVSAVFNSTTSFLTFQRRILNGRDVKENEFPYTVIIRGPGKYCGGALLNSQFVVTAAHCLMDLDEGRRFQEVSVILGSRNYYAFDGEEPKMIRLKANTFWIHENFSMPSAQDDIAIIKLPRKINFNDKISPVSVSRDEKVDQHGNEVLGIISGWGEMDLHQPADVLQTAEMKLIPISECFMFQKKYVEKITQNHICAIGLNSKPGREVGPCSGDSGSPLVLAETSKLIGITSFVKDAEDGKALWYNDCDDGKAPAVYVRVASYLDWISAKTGIRIPSD